MTQVKSARIYQVRNRNSPWTVGILMPQKLTKAQAFTLADRPALAKLVADAREAFGADSGYAERIGRAGASLAAKRGTLPPRSVVNGEDDARED